MAKAGACSDHDLMLVEAPPHELRGWLFADGIRVMFPRARLGLRLNFIFFSHFSLLAHSTKKKHA